MTATVALFNVKAGVGKTSLVYHLAHMMARLGRSVLAADLDPQANLTARFLDGSDLESLWGGDEADHETVAGAVHPLVEGRGEVRVIPPPADRRRSVPPAR